MGSQVLVAFAPIPLFETYQLTSWPYFLGFYALAVALRWNHLVSKKKVGLA